ncbi:MAG: sulfatase [Verrucomicrobia bacterium]|nr:sulfatase [Verrucomicrobiota bacterium]
MCNPSRASLLTGLRPSTLGIYGLAPGIRNTPVAKDCVTLPQYFARQGYFTAAFGKIFHDGSIPKNLQTNEFNVWGPAPGMPMPKAKLVQTPATMWMMDWGAFPADDREQPDWKTADNAIAQLQARPLDKPFFLAVGFRLPHVPCFASQKWFDLFPENQTVLPPVKGHDFERDGVPFFSWYLHWQVPEPRLSWLQQANQWRPLVRSYLASTTFMDSQIGRVLDALDASGEATNTVVVLWSDNGWHLGEKDMTGKCSLWERSTHVPLIFAGPGVARAAKCTQPIELLDIYPTLVELCCLPCRSGLEGHSLVRQLKNAEAQRPWPAITTHNVGNHAVRTDRWHYIRYANGAEELYDMQADPNEWTNLAAAPKNMKLIRDLAKWLPQVNLPPAPGSTERVLVRQNGVWLWEGKPIKMEELEQCERSFLLGSSSCQRRQRRLSRGRNCRLRFKIPGIEF